ncbi:MAG: magnesium chelatase [Alkaliphilus sp.]|nr:MoxR family ATPase [Alkaliphilus transvaalensis]PHS31118.1 MAG: magnesium chelatase [Alkaliphilus sp.]
MEERRSTTTRGRRPICGLYQGAWARSEWGKIKLSGLDIITKILNNLNRVIIGKEEAIEKVLVCFLAGGHLLIEDVPGVGKTTMIKALAKSVNLSYSRVQFTPDVMPSDIIGTTIYNRKEEKFEFIKGPVFEHILLADEINRTSPKTQSSLLQAMEESEVSVDGKLYQLKKPFMVLATQNPIEYQGTFPLPESQLDRFLMSLSIGYPSAENEVEVIRQNKANKTLSHISEVASESDILELQKQVENVHAHDDILNYIIGLSNASRTHADVSLGASPRASIDLFKASKALAFIRNRNYVIPDDVKEIMPYVFEHRLILSSEARIKNKNPKLILREIIKRVYVPVVRQVEHK